MTAASARAGALLISVALGLAPTAAAQPAAPTFVITHITVIDATGAPAKPEMTVVITGNRIAAIGAASNVVVPRGAHVVDGKGQYLIPGLWDMHVHVFSKEMPWPAGPGINNKDFASASGRSGSARFPQLEKPLILRTR